MRGLGVIFFTGYFCFQVVKPLMPILAFLPFCAFRKNSNGDIDRHLENIMTWGHVVFSAKIKWSTGKIAVLVRGGGQVDTRENGGLSAER